MLLLSLGAAAAAGVSLAIWAVAFSEDSHVGSGPLAPPPGKTSIGVPVPVGEPFSDGMLTARNMGEEPLVLDRASLVRPTKGVKLVGAYVVTRPRQCATAGNSAPHDCLFYSWRDSQGRIHTSRRTAIGFVAGFQMPRDGRPLHGWEVAPGAEVQVVLGVKVTTPGRHRFEALSLTYHGGGTTFQDVYESSGQLCAPAREYVDRCPGLLDQAL
jgi:hypothetical protein